MLIQRFFFFFLILLGGIFFINPSFVGASDVSDLLSCPAGDCINKSNFNIDVTTISPGGASLMGSTGKGTVNTLLAAVINKLIVAFGVLALFIMTIGAGYMIIHHGQDEFLSRGKAIFIAWLTSLAVALSAWLIVKFISYLLYQ